MLAVICRGLLCEATKIRAIGLCARCYSEDLKLYPRKPAGPCEVLGCTGTMGTGSKGLCGSHYKISWKYGLPPEKIAKLINDNAGICPICLLEVVKIGRNTGWHIDHNHACCPGARSCGNCVRGAICARCNMLLGNANDDSGTLHRAAQYLNDRRQG